MDCQVPDHVYIALEQTEARSNAVVVIDLAELVLKHELADLLHRRRIEEGVIHHQRQPAPIGFVDEATHLIGRLSERLLYQHMLSRLQRSESQLKVRMNRRCDRDRVYLADYARAL